MCETLKKMITSKTNNDYILSKTWQYIECDYILIFFFLQIIYMSYAKTNETRNKKGKQSQNCSLIHTNKQIKDSCKMNLE